MLHIFSNQTCLKTAWGGFCCFLLVATLSVASCGDPNQQQTTGKNTIQVCVSSTDAKAIAQAIGGDAVSITGFVRGVEDPHMVEPTRSMIQALNTAELLIVVGLGLEQAWLPPMLDGAKNDQITIGTKGYLDLSDGLRTLIGKESQGVPNSYHPEDNPHYLLDPVEAIRAASLIRDRLIELRPDSADAFNARYNEFSKQVATELLGPVVANELPDTSYQSLSEICIQIEHGELPAGLGGQLLAMQPYAGKPVIGDHDLWPYFARRYGVHVLGYLEPEPGLPPTVPHLTKLMAKMKQHNCNVLLSVAYFDLKQADFLVKQADANLVRMANLPGSLDNTETHLDWMRYNANALLNTFKGE